MARPPVISYRDVEDAVTLLQAKGKPVNPYQVRSMLGRGSEAKILHYLTGMGVEIQDKGDDPLTKRLANLIRPVALEMNEQCDAQIKMEKAALEKQLEQERLSVRETGAALASTREQLARETSSHMLVQKKAERLQHDLAGLQKQMLITQHDREHLAEKVKNLNSVLEDTRSDIEVARKEHADMVGLLKNEHAETITGYRHALEQSGETIKRFSAQSEQLNVRNHALSKEVKEMQVKLDQNQAEKNEGLARIEAQNVEIASETKKNRELKNRFLELEKILSATNKRLETFDEIQQANASLKAGNQALRAEKSLLSRELDLLRSVLERLPPVEKEKARNNPEKHR